MDTVDTVEIEPQHRDKIRVFTLVIFIFIAIMIALYTLLFTSWGNRQCAPLIEDQLSKTLETNITLSTFSLDLEHFELAFHSPTQTHAHVQGTYQLFPPSIDANYKFNTSSPTSVIPIPLHLNGSIKGSYARLNILGDANLMGGEITYDSLLRFTALSALHLTFDGINYQTLMDLLEYPHDSDTLLFGDLSINGIDKRSLNISGKLIATTHRFSPSKLIDDDNESFNVWELLADQNGKIQPFNLHADLNASVDELGILEQFVSYPLRTSANLHTTIEGSQHDLSIDANGTVAKGKLTASLSLHKLRPQYLTLEAKQLDAGTLFSLLSLPHPIEGTLGGNLSSDFNTTTLKVRMNQGKTDPSILKQHYHITQPFIHFDSSLTMKFTPTSTYTTGQFTSDLDNLRFEGSPTHDAMLRELLRQMKQKSSKGNI